MEPGRGAATVAAAAEAVVARASIARASLAGREAAAALAAVDAVPLKEPGMNIVLMQALFRGSLARKRVERLRKGRGMKAEVLQASSADFTLSENSHVLNEFRRHTEASAMLAVTNAPQNLREPLLKTLGAAFMRLMRCHEASKKVRRCRTLADLLDAAHGALVDALSFDRSDAPKLSATVHQVCPMQADGSGAPGDELLDLGDFCFMEARRLPFVEPALEARDTLLWSERTEIEEVASDVGLYELRPMEGGRPVVEGERRRGSGDAAATFWGRTDKKSRNEYTTRAKRSRMETRLATGSVPKETSVLASAGVVDGAAAVVCVAVNQGGEPFTVDDRLIMHFRRTLRATTTARATGRSSRRWKTRRPMTSVASSAARARPRPSGARRPTGCLGSSPGASTPSGRRRSRRSGTCEPCVF